ncbi:MAG: 4Fe-4S binding protein [Chloroflexi bacterium]|nr:4Fe-4S binding protein [Chloroflexota bacterium]
MNEIVVISGKGGTGKTSIVACFAVLAQDKVMVDCDVDAADLHLLLQPALRESAEFWSGQCAAIDEAKCTECGMCEEACRFGAIKDFRVDPHSCEGCGFCFHVCPEGAITMHENLSGNWFVSDTRYGPLVHARLGVAQENSGKLVTLVRQRARSIAEEQGLNCILSDGPPGIGCPVIASLSGTSLALVVTEPTLSGIHDMDRIIGVCQHFGIPPLVCINKYDINEENTRRIESNCLELDIPVVSKIPFDNVVIEALARGLPVVEYSRDSVSRQIEKLWQTIVAREG